MNAKTRGASFFLYGSLLAFLTYTIYLLFAHQEVLYTAHDRSEFLFGVSYFHSLLARPFGMIQYVGAWLTQLFYYPALGSGVMLAIWALIFYVGVQAFRLQLGARALMLLPVACLLASIVDLGYWIYILPTKGYWFSQSVGYLLMLLLLWVARLTPRRWHLAWYLLGLCLYPVLGWFALLFVLCLALAERPSWPELLAVVLLLFTANAWRALLYSNLNLADVMLAGMPRFDTPADSAPRLAIPFWVLGAVTLLIPLCGKFLSRWFVPVLCALAGMVFTWSFTFSDRTYLDEMRMVRYASADQWEQVIHVAEENPRPSGTMVMLKNIALMNEGGLLDRSFRLGNNNNSIYNPDSLHVTLLNIASPLAYYNYGMMNEAIRLSFENAVPAGFSPYYLKVLARCAQATGEEQLMDRFLTLLHHHPFYAQWQPAPVSAAVRELQHSYPDEISGVENSDSYIVNSISLWYESDNKLASEQALFYAMIRCDSRRFWASLRKYAQLHRDENFPVHAQEAYIMYMDKAPEEKRMMLPVEQEVYERYGQFWSTLEGIAKPGMKLEKIGEQMREEWGGTYWYYNVFGHKVY